jgi:MoaA/NifB/PqqE/SkfB family radical SAM enzyme
VPRDLNFREHLSRIQFYVSERCNNDCVFCLDADRKPENADGSLNRDGLPLPDLRLDLAQVDAFLDGFDRGTEVAITGPDAGTNRQLVDYVARVRALGFARISLVTNGRTLASGSGGRDLAARLVEAGLTRFEISIHAPQAEAHDAATGRRGSFIQTEAGLHAALAARNGAPADVRVETITVVYAGNVHLLDDMARFLLSRGVDRASFNLVEPKGEVLRRFDELTLRLTRAAAAFKQLLKRYGSRFRFSVDGVPSCLLAGMEGFAGNREEVHLGDAEGRLFDHERRDQWRVFGPDCARCVHRPVCIGVFRRYVEAHGFDELIPARFKGDVLPAPGDRARYVALFYDRWERRYQGLRAEVERGRAERLDQALPAGLHARLLNVDDAGFMIALHRAPARAGDGPGPMLGACRVRPTPERAVPARFRVGAFVLLPEDEASASALSSVMPAPKEDS